MRIKSPPCPAELREQMIEVARAGGTPVDDDAKLAAGELALVG